MIPKAADLQGWIRATDFSKSAGLNDGQAAGPAGGYP
jgi:hypothetical protein